MAEIINNPNLKNIRQDLRNNMPKPEMKIWYFIKWKQLWIKFRRQVSIWNYIVDFYSFDKKLVIEIDWDSHFISKEVIEKDKERTEFLNSNWIKVIRFTNLEIMKNIEWVLEEIKKEILVLS